MSDYYMDNIAKQQAAAGLMDQVAIPRNRSIVVNLKAQRSELTARIEKIDTLLDVLEKNPDFAKMFDLARELV